MARLAGRHSASSGMSSGIVPHLRENFILILIGGLLAVLAFAGGASRADAPQQILVRLVAILLLACALMPFDLRPLLKGRRILYWIAACYALLLLQLVPLPFALWASLPGHGLYAEIARATGLSGARPLSLAPDLTLNALYALLPATAAVVLALAVRQSSWERLLAWIVAIAIASSLLGLAQMAAGYPESMTLYRFTTEDSAIGLFANRNHQAFFLASMLPVVAALARQRQAGGAHGGLILAIAAAISAVLILGVVLTQSRMGLVMAGLGLLAAVAIFSMRRDGRPIAGWRLRRLAVPGVVAATGVALTLAGWRLGAVERLSTTDLQAESRVLMLRPLLDAASAFMPFGSGFGSFDGVFRRSRAARAAVPDLYERGA